jgi:putative ABC transport system permease protein
MTGAHVGVLPDKPGSEAVFVAARYAYADFFPMFNAPLLHGRGWTAQEDTDLARVVVIDRDLATQLFGAPQAALMQTVIVRGERLQVIGVMDRWRVNPFFFDLTMGAYGRKEQFWMPFRTAMELKFGSSGSMNCWGAGPQGGSPRDLQAQCAWLQYWVELPDAAAASAYKTHLERYSEAQRSAGRFQRPVNVRLRDVNEHLSFRRAVPGDVRLQNLLALGFLAVCLVNMAGLLLAKTLRRSGEIGVRRALGATRRTVFAQFLVESGLVGLLGSLLGLVCAGIGLWLVRLGPSSHAQLAQMDLTLLWATLGLGLLASLLAGLLPAWQASRVSPAIQLKVQ